MTIQLVDFFERLRYDLVDLGCAFALFYLLRISFGDFNDTILNSTLVLLIFLLQLDPQIEVLAHSNVELLTQVSDVFGRFILKVVVRHVARGLVAA